MVRTVGIPPKFLEKLDEVQRRFILTAVGRRFYDEFLCGHGKHLGIWGLTNAGKTNKGYWIVDWLKHLELQIWISSGKSGEILPLLCQDRKIRIVVPAGVDIVIEEYTDGKWIPIPNHPEILPVNSPLEMLMSISEGSWDKSRHRIRDTITILEVRNAFSERTGALEWMAEFFELLAKYARESKLPNILPASMHFDESQWAVAGKRISDDPLRSKIASIITENALELRSIGIRLVMYAQSYTNIPPAARENMLYNIICHGVDIKSDENQNLAKWCRYNPYRIPPSPSQYKVQQGRFIFENGDSFPPESPWSFRKFPKFEEDQEWVSRLRVRYIGKHDQRTEENEIEEELLPELGRFSAMAIPPEEKTLTDPGKVISRYDLPAFIEG